MLCALRKLTKKIILRLLENGVLAEDVDSFVSKFWDDKPERAYPLGLWK
jgi:hypothetical protein